VTIKEEGGDDDEPAQPGDDGPKPQIYLPDNGRQKEQPEDS